ncbi:DUF3817 domain-containing protein [Carnimonas nigrificans]|uniref:DUF3817 domain-containing protein n=1 Tax=Carnimonas nigrificans TaxID=64323 RepID=UPI00046FF8AC|nr:DUF3817 domain-containing protein [Carnimonas nigrificans]
MPFDATALKRLSTLRRAALVEGTTLLLLLFIAVPLKHLAGVPQAVSIMGPIHGVAFICYIVLLLRSQTMLRLDGAQLTKLIVAAFIPFGALYANRFLHGKEASR